MPINSQNFGNTQAHSETNQRDDGSVTHGQDRQIRAADVQRYVEGVAFPVNKKQLADRAKQNHAPDYIVDLLRQLPTPEFGSPNAEKLTEYNSMDELISEIQKVE